MYVHHYRVPLKKSAVPIAEGGNRSPCISTRKNPTTHDTSGTVGTLYWTHRLKADIYVVSLLFAAGRLVNLTRKGESAIYAVRIYGQTSHGRLEPEHLHENVPYTSQLQRWYGHHRSTKHQTRASRKKKMAQRSVFAQIFDKIALNVIVSFIS